MGQAITFGIITLCVRHTALAFRWFINVDDRDEPACARDIASDAIVKAGIFICVHIYVYDAFIVNRRAQQCILFGRTRG